MLIVLCKWHDAVQATEQIIVQVKNFGEVLLRTASGETGRRRLMRDKCEVCLAGMVSVGSCL